MNGTWQGKYSGDNTGRITVEIDDMGDHFNGCAYAYDSDLKLPSTFAVVKTLNKDRKSKFTAPLFPLDPRTREPTEWKHVENIFPAGTTVPTSAEVECEWDDKHLKLSWVANNGRKGSADIVKSAADKPSIRKPLAIATWEEFKRHVIGLELDKLSEPLENILS